jgi:hypothetical protein
MSICYAKRFASAARGKTAAGFRTYAKRPLRVVDHDRPTEAPRLRCPESGNFAHCRSPSKCSSDPPCSKAWRRLPTNQGPLLPSQLCRARGTLILVFPKVPTSVPGLPAIAWAIQNGVKLAANHLLNQPANPVTNPVSMGSNQSSKRWELLSVVERQSSGVVVTFFMAWTPPTPGDLRLITLETTPPSFPTNPATGPAHQFKMLWRTDRRNVPGSESWKVGPGNGVSLLWRRKWRRVSNFRK